MKDPIKTRLRKRRAVMALLIPRARKLLPDERGFLHFSFFSNFVTGTAKLVTGIRSVSVAVLVNGIYSLVLCFAKLLQLIWMHLLRRSGGEGSTSATRTLNAVAVILLGIVFTYSGIHTVQSGRPPDYGGIDVGVLAVCTVVKLALSIYGVARFRADKENVMFSVKMTNLTDALVSLVITQGAILGLLSDENAALYEGTYGILTGIAIAVIGGTMLCALRRRDRHRM